jgi:hypothetical protein
MLQRFRNKCLTLQTLVRSASERQVLFVHILKMADTDLIAWEAGANMTVLLCVQDVSGLNHDFQNSYPA